MNPFTLLYKVDGALRTSNKTIAIILKNKRKAYNTRYSQAGTPPSTNRAHCCLTLVIGPKILAPGQWGHTHYMFYIALLALRTVYDWNCEENANKRNMK